MSNAPNAPRDLDPEVRELIRRKALRLLRGRQLPGLDLEDVYQELAAHVWRRLGRHDDSRGRLAPFLQTVLDNRAADLARAAQAQGRGHTPLPLSLPAESAPPGEDEPPFPEDRRRAAPRDEAADSDRRLDVAEALRRLPQHLRDLAEALKQGGISPAARTLGIHRDTARQWRDELRRHLRDAGLGPDS